jgi:hypothetical protein
VRRTSETGGGAGVGSGADAGAGVDAGTDAGTGEATGRCGFAEEHAPMTRHASRAERITHDLYHGKLRDRIAAMPAPNVLFVVHGMGTNLEAAAEPTAWFKEVETALHTAWERFPSLAEENFADYIELYPLSYDQRFRQYTARVAAAGEKLKGKLGNARYAQALAAIGGAGADDEENFLWANVMDVLLYRLGSDFNVEVQVALQLQLAKKVREVWAANTGAPAQFSMLSHSLGTAVAHGMLQRLALGAIGDSDVFKLGGNFKLRCYMTLANVSRLMFRPGGSIYDKTLIRPGKYVESFLNARHIADPVPAPFRFAPPAWGPGYREIPIQCFRQPNLHAFTHYLDHPAVAGALFRSLVPFLIQQAEVDAVVATYPDVDNPDEQKCLSIERVIADIAHELHVAYNDETHLLSDSAELLAGVARRAWENRKALGALT